MAMETFGVSGAQAGTIESMHPETEEEFDEFSSALSKKITEFKVSLVVLFVCFALYFLLNCDSFVITDFPHVRETNGKTNALYM